MSNTIQNAPTAYLTTDEITADEAFNIRQTYDADSIAAMAEDMRRTGQINPVIVRKKSGKGGGYELIAGFRRYRAAKLIDKEAKAKAKETKGEFKPFQIFARVVELDDLEAAALNGRENLMREDITSYERAVAATRLRDQLGGEAKRGSGAAAARMLGLTTGYTNNLIRALTKCIPAVVSAWKNPAHKHHNLTNLENLTKLAGMEEEEQVAAWARQTGDVTDHPEPTPAGEGVSGGGGEPTVDKRRPTTTMLEKAVKAVAASDESDEWKRGATAALEFAMGGPGGRKTLAGYNPTKEREKADRAREEKKLANGAAAADA